MRLECRDIVKKYSDTVILDHISYLFKPTKMTMIQGKSGSGKSTLLNVLSKHLEVDSGEVICDHSLLRFVFQNHYLINELNIKENILSGIENTDQAVDEAYFNYLIQTLNIQHCLNKRVKECSQGECQRVNIARALIAKPDLILMDEPTGNLDEHNTQEVMKLIKHLQNELSLTILCVSHDQSLEKYMDEVLYLENGKLEIKKTINESRELAAKEKIKPKTSKLKIMEYVSLFLLHHKWIVLLQCLCVAFCSITIFLSANIGSNLKSYYYEVASKQPNHLQIAITSKTGTRILSNEINEIQQMEHITNVTPQYFLYGWQRSEEHKLSMQSETGRIEESEQLPLDAFISKASAKVVSGDYPTTMFEMMIDSNSAEALNIMVNDTIHVVIPYVEYYQMKEYQDPSSVYPFFSMMSPFLNEVNLEFRVTGIFDSQENVYRGMMFHEQLNDYFLDLVSQTEVPEGMIQADSAETMTITVDALENVVSVYELLAAQYDHEYQNTVVTIMKGFEDLNNIEDIYRIISALVAIVMIVVIIVILRMLLDKKDRMINVLSLFNFSNKAVKWFYFFESIFILIVSLMLQLVILNFFVPFFNKFLFKVNPIVFQLQIALDNELQLLHMNMSQISIAFLIVVIAMSGTQYWHYKKHLNTNAVMTLKEDDDL